MGGWDQELEDFKRIDLRQYAAAQGYALDPKEKSRRSAVMIRDFDKIVVKLNGNGHYIYFSVRDDNDNGTIVDFVQRRRRMSLGEVRKELRPWVGRSAAPLPLFPPMERTSKDLYAVELAWRRMEDEPQHPYLIRERCLSPALLSSPRFAGRIRIDERGNAVFPHFNAEGLCGYELKNRGYTGFAKGGEKGLWISRTWQSDKRLILAESAIDALSHAGLFPDPSARYASVGGALNAKERELIGAAVQRMPAGAEIVSAMDNDDAGQKLTEIVRQVVAETGRTDVSFRAHFPDQDGADWNDVLRAQANSSPIARPSLG